MPLSGYAKRMSDMDPDLWPPAGLRLRTSGLEHQGKAWRQNQTVPVTIDGLEPCLPKFGLSGDEAAAV